MWCSASRQHGTRPWPDYPRRRPREPAINTHKDPAGSESLASVSWPFISRWKVMQLVTRRATGCAGLAAATGGSARYWTDYRRRIPLIVSGRCVVYGPRGGSHNKRAESDGDEPKQGHEVLMKLASSGGYRGRCPSGTCGAQALKAEQLRGQPTNGQEQESPQWRSPSRAEQRDLNARNKFFRQLTKISKAAKRQNLNTCHGLECRNGKRNWRSTISATASLGVAPTEKIQAKAMTLFGNDTS